MTNDQNQAENPEIINGYTARWIVPVSRPPIEHGVIIVRGQQILEVASADELHIDINTPLVDLGDSIIFPGFINAHTHLEHPALANPLAGFVEYIKFLYETRNQASEEEKTDIAAANLQDSMNFGTIALADFTSQGAAYAALQASPVFARLFYEVNGFKGYESDQIIRACRALIQEPSSERRITKHLAPSSVWSTSPQLFREINLAERHIAVHMDIIPDENEFTQNGTGLIRQILLAHEDFDYTWQVPGLSAIQYFFSNYFYARHNILTHMTFSSAEEIDYIKNFGVKVNVCLCPRSSRILSGAAAPVGMLLEKGINICLGTESRVLVSDLDIRKEMIACVDSYAISPESVLKFATLNGAYAIGFHKEVGSLEAGKTAHCLVADCSGMASANPYETILNSSVPVRWLI